MSIVFDRATAFYDQTRGLPEHVERWLAQAVRDQAGLEPGSTMLEIGVGTGRIALPIVRLGAYRYVGVDLSPSMMNVLRAKVGALPICLARADIAQLPFGDHPFDAVVAVHVFHLIDGWQQALAEVGRVLRPTGMLLHGYTHHDEDSPLQELRATMLARAAALEDHPRPALLQRDAVELHLEQRFGAPRVYTSPAWTVTQTPRQVIEHFKDRIWSATWSLPDSVLSEAVSEGRTWAAARWDLDTPIQSEQHFVWNQYLLSRR